MDGRYPQLSAQVVYQGTSVVRVLYEPCGWAEGLRYVLADFRGNLSLKPNLSRDLNEELGMGRKKTVCNDGVENKLC